MIEAQIGLKTPDGAMPTRTYRPDGAGPFPVVIFYMDGVAIRPTLFDMARRLASHGYYVALPDLFYRAGPYEPFDGATVFGDPDARAKLMELIKSVTTSGLAVDTQAIIAHVDRDAAADATRIGTVGYCMGGGLAITLAANHDKVRAVVCFYGIPGEETDLAKIPGSVLGHFGDHDDFASPEAVHNLEQGLKAAGVPHTFYTYPGGHAFTNEDRPEVYNADADELSWQRSLEFLNQQLNS